MLCNVLLTFAELLITVCSFMKVHNTLAFALTPTISAHFPLYLCYLSFAGVDVHGRSGIALVPCNRRQISATTKKQAFKG